jgi:heme-degrading monooxygenase HmoA
MPFIAKTPKPPYYAVVFTSVNAPGDHTEHARLSAHLAERAKTFEGFLGIEAVRGADGKGVTVVYYRDLESISEWAKDPEHQAAKKKGRELWYSHYLIRICKVERDYGRADS